MIKKENYIVIQGFMITDLKLKGNELLIYAIIYGFSQTDNQWFNGSRQYLADWTNSTKQGVQKCLNSLVNKGLIDKREKYVNNVKYCEYRVTNLTGQQSLPDNKVDWGSKQSCSPQETKLTGGSKQSCSPQETKLTGGSKQSCPNNLNNTTTDILNDTQEDTIEYTTKQTNNPRQKTSPVYYPDELLNQAFIDFIEMRKKIRKPMTDRAIELMKKKLKGLAASPLSESMDNDLAIKILEQSTMNCWQSLYPLKDDNSNKTQNVYDEWRNA